LTVIQGTTDDGEPAVQADGTTIDDEKVGYGSDVPHLLNVNHVLQLEHRNLRTVR
jgi:hypothetical protein